LETRGARTNPLGESKAGADCHFRALHVRLEGVMRVAAGTPADSGHCGNINIGLWDVSQDFPPLVILGAYRESC